MSKTNDEALRNGGDSMQNKALQNQNLEVKKDSEPVGLESANSSLRIPENIIGNMARIALCKTLKASKNLTVVKPVEISKGKNYKAEDIMMNFTYCQAPKTDRGNMKQIYNELQNTKDYRLSLIQHSTAYSMLEKNQTGHGLEVYVSISKDIRPIAPMPMLKNVLGAYIPGENILYMSNVRENKDFAKAIMMHELTHKVRDLFTDKDNKEVDKAENEMRRFFAENKIDKNDKAAIFVKTTILDRIENARHAYSNQDAIREEMVADVARICVFMEQNPKNAQRMKEVAKPLLNYFDKHMVPRMEQYILNHPMRKVIELPEEMRKNLSKQRNLTSGVRNFEKAQNSGVKKNAVHEMAI